MEKQTAGRENLGELATKFAELNDDVLFGQGEPNVKHWHGATAKSWFSHIAVEVPGENTSNEWCEKVTDEDYDKLPE